jgi:transketolase
LRNTFINNLTELASKDESIFLVVGDLGYGVVEVFENKFPSRFLNAGIAEQNMIGLSAGLAKSGYKVFVYSIANFPTLRCLEQIRNDVCYGDLDVTIVSVGAGFSYGVLGYSHFAIEDISIMRTLPGIQILSPSDPVEVKSAVKYALNNPGPKYLRLGKNGEQIIHGIDDVNLESPIEIKNGNEFCLLVTGSIATEALQAVKKFHAEFNINIAVFTIPIISTDLLDKFKFNKFSRIFTLEENVANGGFGSFIAEFIVDNGISVDLTRISISLKSVKLIGDQEYLRKMSGIDFISVYNILKSKIIDI